MNGLKTETTKQKGFTIIEVVLVLAIAGLIFLMVFIALPALQRNQRDTQRKNDMGRLQTAIVSYTSSNRGALPTSGTLNTSFVTSYLTTGGDDFIDPSGASSAQGSGVTSYVFTNRDVSTGDLTTSFADSQNIIYSTRSATCGNAGGSVAAAGSRKIAFRIALEGGGYYCVNN